MVQPATELHPRLSAEHRRRQIIEVAIDLFSRRGFNGTTTKEIAAAAGVNEAIIFRHFAGKEQLYAAILDYRRNSLRAEEWLSEMQSFMAENNDEAVFRHLTAKIIQLVHDDPKFERVMLYAALEGHELAAMHHKQFAIPFIDMLIDYITRRQQEGALRQIHPGAVVFAAAGMAQQYATHTFMCDYKDAGFSTADAIDFFTRILMHGISTGHTGRGAE